MMENLNRSQFLQIASMAVALGSAIAFAMDIWRGETISLPALAAMVLLAMISRALIAKGRVETGTVLLVYSIAVLAGTLQFLYPPHSIAGLMVLPAVLMLGAMLVRRRFYFGLFLLVLLSVVVAPPWFMLRNGETWGSVFTFLLTETSDRIIILGITAVTVQFVMVDLRRGARKLEESEASYRTLFGSAIHGNVVLRETSRIIIDVNQTACDLLGVKQNQLLDRTWYSLLAERLLHPTLECVRDELDQLGMEEPATQRIKLLNAESILYLECSYKSVVVRDERVIIVQIRDETDHVRAEMERDRLVNVVEQNRSMVLLTDPGGRIEYLNAAYRKHLGARAASLIGEPHSALAPFLKRHADYSTGCLTALSGETWSGHLERVDEAQDVLITDTVFLPLLDAEGEVSGCVEMSRDITREQALERQLLQAQKMEAIGMLAGGVAHDFNNILQVISSNNQLAHYTSEGDAGTRAYLDEIDSAVVRATTLVRQLLVFGRRQALEPQPVDVNDLISSLLRMLQRVIGESIELRYNAESGLGLVMADAGQIEQVVMNLCVNARDAMPDGGRLTLATRTVTFTEQDTRFHPWALAGEFVEVVVSDTGVGMDEVTRARIFEPFYTTKSGRGGTGLGLATVYGIVKQHNGMIQVYSEPGGGTVFRLYLPLARDVALPAEAAPARHAMEGGTETLLIAEDDPALLEVMRDTFDSVGYTVLSAKDGAEAVSLFRHHDGNIDLVVLDAVMPGMDGFGACRIIRETAPGCPMLIVSGYSQPSLEDGGAGCENVSWLEKPYRPNDLLQTVRNLLNHAPAPR